jgi:hypothetical protein
VAARISLHCWLAASRSFSALVAHITHDIYVYHSKKQKHFMNQNKEAEYYEFGIPKMPLTVGPVISPNQVINNNRSTT